MLHGKSHLWPMNVFPNDPQTLLNLLGDKTLPPRTLATYAAAPTTMGA